MGRPGPAYFGSGSFWISTGRRVILALVLCVAVIFGWAASHEWSFVAGAIRKAPTGFVYAPATIRQSKHILVCDTSVEHQEVRKILHLFRCFATLPYQIWLKSGMEFEAVSIHSEGWIRQKNRAGIIKWNWEIVGTVNKTVARVATDDLGRSSAFVDARNMKSGGFLSCPRNGKSPSASVMLLDAFFSIGGGKLLNDTHRNPSPFRIDDGLSIQESGIGNFFQLLRVFPHPDSLFPNGNQGSDSNYYKQEIANIGNPVESVSFWIPINRDVCGGKFADLYGGWFLYGGFAIAIVLECLAVAILFDDCNRRLGWVLAGISLLFWVLAGLTPPIGRLPWDWFKTPAGCHDESEYRQIFQHDAVNVSDGARRCV